MTIAQTREDIGIDLADETAILHFGVLLHERLVPRHPDEASRQRRHRVRAVQVDLHAEPLVIRDGHRVDHDPHASVRFAARDRSLPHRSYIIRPPGTEGQFLTRREPVLPFTAVSRITLVYAIRRRRRIHAVGAGDEHRHAQAVPNLVDGLAQEQVADHSVAVRADDQKVDRVLPQVADEFAGRDWGRAARPVGPCIRGR